MRKKSFWLSLNPRNPPCVRTSRPAPHRGVLRPPRRPCTRRPVSSGATGGRGEPGPGKAPCRRQRHARRPGLFPWRRSPFSSVSSSSSSFLSPAVSRGCSGCFPAPGFVLRSRFSGPSSDGPSIRFKSVKIVFVFELAPRCRQAASVVPSGGLSVRLRPAPPGFRRVRIQFGWPFSAPSVFPAYHPVPASCSARLLFVPFMVRISVSFCVQFRSFSARSVRSCPSRLPVRFSSVLSVSLSCSFQLVSDSPVLNLFCARPVRMCVCYYYSRVYYTR